MSEALQVIHEQQGLTIWRNPKNQFVVARLHYTADPTKRSEKWRWEAQAGMTPEKFAREYEIDWTAILGAKVFPEFSERRKDIIVEEPWPDFGPDVPYWGGFDYGVRNPTSFHIYTIIDGCFYSIWELYKPCKNIVDFAAEMKQFPYWSKIRYIAADPKCWANDQQMSDGLISIADILYRNGVRNLIKGPRDEAPWIAMVHQMWAQEDPTFKILSCCPNQIREFETAIYMNQSERQRATQVFKEAIADHDNHSLDDCKYLMLTKPNASTRVAGWSAPNQALRWTVPSSGPSGRPMSKTGPKGYY